MFGIQSKSLLLATYFMIYVVLIWDDENGAFYVSTRTFSILPATVMKERYREDKAFKKIERKGREGHLEHQQ